MKYNYNKKEENYNLIKISDSKTSDRKITIINTIRSLINEVSTNKDTSYNVNIKYVDGKLYFNINSDKDNFSISKDVDKLLLREMFAKEISEFIKDNENELVISYFTTDFEQNKIFTIKTDNVCLNITFDDKYIDVFNMLHDLVLSIITAKNEKLNNRKRLSK